MIIDENSSTRITVFIVRLGRVTDRKTLLILWANNLKHNSNSYK